MKVIIMYSKEQNALYRKQRKVVTTFSVWPLTNWIRKQPVILTSMQKRLIKSPHHCVLAALAANPSTTPENQAFLYDLNYNQVLLPLSTNVNLTHDLAVKLLQKEAKKYFEALKNLKEDLSSDYFNNLVRVNTQEIDYGLSFLKQTSEKDLLLFFERSTSPPVSRYVGYMLRNLGKKNLSEAFVEKALKINFTKAALYLNLTLSQEQEVLSKIKQNTEIKKTLPSILNLSLSAFCHNPFLKSETLTKILEDNFYEEDVIENLLLNAEDNSNFSKKHFEQILDKLNNEKTSTFIRRDIFENISRSENAPEEILDFFIKNHLSETAIYLARNKNLNETQIVKVYDYILTMDSANKVHQTANLTRTQIKALSYLAENPNLPLYLQIILSEVKPYSILSALANNSNLQLDENFSLRFIRMALNMNHDIDFKMPVLASTDIFKTLEVTWTGSLKDLIEMIKLLDN